jgi:hypothetical protein
VFRPHPARLVTPQPVDIGRLAVRDRRLAVLG